jgi:N6-L-threonylcarbamoyladenine synthase
VEIDHIKAHLYANFLYEKTSRSKFHAPSLPAVGLVVSGGHSSLFYIKNFQDFHLLGQTRDDAAGEAYDKVARILELGYPGGPVLDRLAQQGRKSTLRFPVAALPNSFDFSFSGLKTAVYYHAKKHKNSQPLLIPEIAYAFQESVIQSLVHKSLLCCRQKKVKTLLVGGGVAANFGLRQQLCAAAKIEGINVFFPAHKLCTDNAAMVSGLGYHLLSVNQKNKGGGGGKPNS